MDMVYYLCLLWVPMPHVSGGLTAGCFFAFHLPLPTPASSFIPCPLRAPYCCRARPTPHYASHRCHHLTRRLLPAAAARAPHAAPAAYAEGHGTVVLGWAYSTNRCARFSPHACYGICGDARSLLCLTFYIGQFTLPPPPLPLPFAGHLLLPTIALPCRDDAAAWHLPCAYVLHISTVPFPRAPTIGFFMPARAGNCSGYRQSGRPPPPRGCPTLPPIVMLCMPHLDEPHQPLVVTCGC